ncbi:MAG: hypothetical protein IKW04_03770 [Clostridia bacterium]|nr:hypothetical protein [Clostridia bacterium]
MKTMKNAKNTKQSLLENPIVKKLHENLPLICCIIAVAGFLFLPFTLINKGNTQKYPAVGIEFLLNVGGYHSNPGYVGNQGGNLILALFGTCLLFVLCAALAIFGSIKKKKKAYNWGIGIGVIALVAMFVVLVMFPYYVPNSLGRKAFLFTEIGRTFNGLGIGFWLALVGLIASVLIVEKREKK